jgi:hypothetical protein
MPEYTWACHVCGRVNQKSCETCISCDCPAFATGKEILNRNKAREPELVNSVAKPKHSLVLTWIYLFLVSIALFYTTGYYVAGKGAESDFGFIAFVVSSLLSLIFGGLTVVGIFGVVMNLAQRFTYTKKR